jgi:hypothetical protein
MPIQKFPEFYGGQMGVPGSDTPLGLRAAPQGLVYYVDGSHADASDNNDGTNPNQPKATIQSAITASNATITWANTPPYVGVNWIVVSPGVYAENLTPPYYARIIGLGLANGGDVCVNVEPAAGSPLAGTGLGLHLYNIRFTCNTAAPVLDFGVFNSCIVEDCMICDGNPGLATVGVDITGAGGSKIVGCNFAYNTNPLTRGIRSTGNFFDCYITDCRIKAVTTGIDLSAGGLFGGSEIYNNRISGGGSVLLGTGIDDSVTGDTLCVNNYITATDAISHADAAMTIANHVIDAGVGAVELAGTD